LGLEGKEWGWVKTRKERGRDLLEQCQTASHTLVVSVVTSDVLSFGPCSFVVLKGKISVLGLGLEGLVLGPGLGLEASMSSQIPT